MDSPYLLVVLVLFELLIDLCSDGLSETYMLFVLYAFIMIK